jgi:type I restriction enzyme S subunit
MTTTKNNIPAGYKDSAVGIIPQEWEVATLGKLVSITSGESPSLFNRRNIGKYPYIKVEDMNNCEKYQSFSREYTDDERCAIPKGSIIFPKRGAAIINNKVRIANCALYMDSNMMAITPNDLACGDYLYFKIIHEQLFKIADTSTIPQINNKHIIPYKISLPPMAEQKKIAEILEIWDEAIEKQNLLIEKLELRKRALMQRLLTGKTRLHGFTEPWQKVKLGEIAQIKKGKSLTYQYVKCGIYPVIAGGKDSPYSHNEYNDENVVTISASGAYAGYISYYPHKIWASDCSVVKEMHTKSNIIFLYNLLLYNQLYIYSLQVGGAQPHVFPKDIERIKLLCPSLSEQKAIAEVLSTADKEIAIHSKTLDALRLQKRGLMQQLLTGKTRVKI